MKLLVLAALALAAGISAACADEFTISKIENIATLPCSAFHGHGWTSLKPGIAITIPLSATNNKELFVRLGERSAQCRHGGGSSPILSDASTH